jgi:Domain of unknown function (DUF4020)
MPRDGMTVVVDAARDVLSSISSDNPELARATIERWAGSASPLLRRLAVHGVREADWMSSDEKLAWLVDRNLLYDSSVKHETFEVLANAYVNAGEDARRLTLKRIRQGIPAKDNPGLKKRTREYERYNLLYWLSKTAPDDQSAQEAFRLEQERHSDFAPRDDPDLDFGDVRAVAVQSSMTVEELLKKRVGDVRVTKGLIDFKDETHWFDMDRYAFLGVIGDAAATNPGWGLRLGTSLAKLDAWGVDLWRGLAEGWARSEADDRTWSRIFALLRVHKEPAVFIHEATRLLTEFTRGDRDPRSAAMQGADHLSDVLWASIASDEDEWVLGGIDWLTAAINEPGGKIAEFWIRQVSLRKRTDAAGLSDRDRGRFSAILAQSGRAADAGRILLASQFHFLLAIDREWTKGNVLPLFDWDVSEQRAEQAWDGYLTWGRLNEAVIGTMLPMYVASFSRLADRSDEWRRKFTDHLAAIAVRSTRTAVEDEWLAQFVKTTSVESRAEWASHVAYLLRSLEPDAKIVQWEKWIRQYWVDRLAGIPRALARAEAGELVAWAVSLEPVFQEAVDLLAQGPAGRPPGYVYDLLDKSELVEVEAASVAKLLSHILSDERPPFYPCHYTLSILKRIPRKGLRGELEHVVNQLVGLGCDGALSIMR